MAKAGGAAVEKLKEGMLYHDIELEATKAMKEDAKNSIGFFANSKGEEYTKYTSKTDICVDEVVKKVMETIEKSGF